MEDLLVSECGGLAREEEFDESDTETGNSGKPSSVDPCLNYSIDVTAKQFGTCKCGHPRSDHNVEVQQTNENPTKDLKPVQTDMENVKPLMSPNREHQLHSTVNVSALKEVFSNTTEATPEAECTSSSPSSTTKPQDIPEVSVVETTNAKLAPTPTSAMKFRGTWNPVINDPAPQHFIPPTTKVMSEEPQQKDESQVIDTTQVTDESVSITMEMEDVTLEDTESRHVTNETILSDDITMPEIEAVHTPNKIALKQSNHSSPLETVASPPLFPSGKAASSYSPPQPQRNIVRHVASPQVAKPTSPSFRSAPIDESNLPRFMRATASSRNRHRKEPSEPSSLAVQNWSKSLR